MKNKEVPLYHPNMVERGYALKGSWLDCLFPEIEEPVDCVSHPKQLQAHSDLQSGSPGEILNPDKNEHDISNQTKP